MAHNMYIFEDSNATDIDDFLHKFTLDPFKDCFLAADELFTLLVQVDSGLVPSGTKLRWIKDLVENLRNGVKHCKEGNWSTCSDKRREEGWKFRWSLSFAQAATVLVTLLPEVDPNKPSAVEEGTYPLPTCLHRASLPTLFYSRSSR